MSDHIASFKAHFQTLGNIVGTFHATRTSAGEAGDKFDECTAAIRWVKTSALDMIKNAGREAMGEGEIMNEGLVMLENLKQAGYSVTYTGSAPAEPHVGTRDSINRADGA